MSKLPQIAALSTKTPTLPILKVATRKTWFLSPIMLPLATSLTLVLAVKASTWEVGISAGVSPGKETLMYNMSLEKVGPPAPRMAAIALAMAALQRDMVLLARP